LIASACILPVLLVVVQPESRVNADKDQDQFRCPSTDA
jgi:hypothetical protein